MTKLFYHLEDYFDDLAEQQLGVGKWASRSLCTMFGFAGDVSRCLVKTRYAPHFDADMAG